MGVGSPASPEFLQEARPLAKQFEHVHERSEALAQGVGIRRLAPQIQPVQLARWPQGQRCDADRQFVRGDIEVSARPVEVYRWVVAGIGQFGEGEPPPRASLSGDGEEGIGQNVKAHSRIPITKNSL